MLITLESDCIYSLPYAEQKTPINEVEVFATGKYSGGKLNIIP